MGFFGLRKRKIIDYTEYYKRKENSKNKLLPAEEKTTDSSGFVPLGFFPDAIPSDKDSFSESSFDYGGSQEKRRKLAKRLVEMTEKIEDLSNQIYHLQQRLELIERRMNPGNFSQDY